MGKNLGWAGVPMGPGVEGLSVQRPPQPGPWPRIPLPRWGAGREGAWGMPPRVSVETSHWGGVCVGKEVMVLVHLQGHPHPQDPKPSGIPTVP